MRVLILSDDFPPQAFGGAGRSTFDLAKGLQKFGHQVFVITTCQEKSCEAEVEEQGIKVFKIFTNFHERWRAYLSLYNPQTVGKVRTIIRKINPDVVHVNNIHSYLSYYCLKIARQYSKAVFLTARDTMLFTFEKLATKRYLENFNPKIGWLDNLKQAKKRYNPLRNIVIKHYLKYIDKIFAISNTLKDALNQNGIQNVEVIYNAIDAGDWLVGSEILEGFKQKYGLQWKKIIFFAGRIGKLKGSEQIELAMDEVKEKIPEAVLLMAGTQGLGWLQGDELKAAFTASDIVVVPSIYLDAFNRTNIEAMVCSKPVVGTCYGGTPEIVEDGVTGYIVNPLNAELMAEKIIDLLGNPQKAKQFGEAGFQRVKKYFSLDSHLTRTISWYQKYLVKE